jgi:hypothetical protein
MKKKLLNAALIITSLMGYLEWGTEQHMFLFEGEWDILSKLFTEPLSVLHPFTLLPLIGQLLLVITLFQKRASTILTMIGMAGMGLLLLFMFFIGMMELNYRIALSCLPFVLVACFTIWEHWKTRSNTNQ